MPSVAPSSSDRDADQDGASGSSSGLSATKLALVGGLVLFVIFAIVIALTDAIFLIALGILAVIVLAFIGVNHLLSARVIRRDGTVERAMADNEDHVPSVGVIGDDDTDLGDTPEAHDEITPHDLPLFHPGRAEAVAQAGGLDGQVTSGHTDPSDASPGSTTPVAPPQRPKGTPTPAPGKPRRPRAHD